MKAEVNLKNIKAYIQGKVRYALYYSWFSFLIPKHIREQIDWRVEIMDKECFDNGSCKICGCETIALQMANKQCPKPCYPEMASRSAWKALKPLYKRLYKYDRKLFNHIIENE